MNTPAMLLAHIGDLIQWAHGWCAEGSEAKYRISEPLEWSAEAQRFYVVLGRFDAFLASGSSLQAQLEAVFQAPIADVFTHIGQLALLRRLAGNPVAGEAYRLAEIVAGRVGPDQAAPVREFERDRGAIWRKPDVVP